MAEKEERIYISKHGENNPCDTCEDTSGDECDSCMENYEWNASIPRQEAIEKMANALSLVQAKTFVDEIQWERVMNGCRYEAEAALNALLSSGE